MLRFLRRFLGLESPAARRTATMSAQGRTAARESARESSEDDTQLEWMLRLDREREDTRRAVNDPYFDALQRLQTAIRVRDYSTASAATLDGLRCVKAFVRNSIREDGMLIIQSIPCLQEGGTVLALTGDEEGLAEMEGIIRSTPELEERWGEQSAHHRESLRLFSAIIAEVGRSPGCRQDGMKERLGEEDGRRVSNLIRWLDKAGRLRRVRDGGTYTLWLPNADDAPRPPASPKLNFRMIQRTERPARVRELDLDTLPYVPLPRAPLRWEERPNRVREVIPKPEEFFEVRDAADWSLGNVEKVPIEDRPDTAYRQLYPMADGVLLIDDLGKAEAHPGAPAAALIFDRLGRSVRSAPLGHDVYRLDANPLGQGVIALSRDCVLHAYGPTIEPLFEYDLRTAPEIQHLMVERHLQPDSVKNHLRAVALSRDNQRFIFTGVDSAWCVDVNGRSLWGLRFPRIERWTEIAVPIEAHNTSAEIADALATLDLALPVAPHEVKGRYRELAKQWHPDVNRDPAATARMQELTAAAQVLTGIDLTHDGGAARTVTVHFTIGGSETADWIYAAGFDGHGHGAFLASYSGKIVQVDATGMPIRVYDIGSVPRRIVDTGDYLYFLTDTRLYVLIEDALHAIVDTHDAGELIMAETGFGLLEKKCFRWFQENGRYVGSIVTRNPIRRVYWAGDALTVETRQRKVHVSGTPAWWVNAPALSTDALDPDEVM